MLPNILSFLLADLTLQLLSKQPSPIIIYCITIISICIWLALRTKFKLISLLLAFTLGLTWTTIQINQTFSYTLPKSQEGKPQQITGHIASIPVKDQWQTSFLFTPDHYPNSYLHLSFRNEDYPITVGDQWQFQTRLKRIHGTQNPGGFDFEAWALQKGLRATGYIQSGKRLSHNYLFHPIDQLRQTLKQKIQANLPNTATAPWLTALIIGERSNIAQEDWQVLRNTGTNHLMAIAGLHIGLMSGMIAMIFAWLWRRVPRLCLYLPAQHAAACAALTTAILYSALAGFSIPTQRACIMLSIFIYALLSKRAINPWQSWSLAMLIVLIINPLCVLTQSFWLSFATIALLIYTMSGRLKASSFWSKHAKPQWVIGIGLTPLSLLFFQECSLVSFVANSIAIPWLGFFILPFCFLSSIFLFISPTIGHWLLLLAAKSLSGLWLVLSWLSNLQLSTWHQAMPNYSIFALTAGGCLLLLLPAGFPGRWLGILWLLPLLCCQQPKPLKGDFWLTLLDVGQGLSVVVQTSSHTLVFDAGPKLNANFDMGENVVLPYLNTIGSKKIDLLVISHGDNDHLGGTHALIKSFAIQQIKTSVPAKIIGHKADYCLSGDTWKWDDVTFSFIYPAMNNINLNNDSSCVLRIDNGMQSVLLTGDIEKFAETEILAKQSTYLKSTILVAPHHGSKTSGLKKFINSVHPNYVLYAIGYRNRYHFPHQSVISAYDDINTIQLNTAVAGEIEFKLNHTNSIASPQLYRMLTKHYWYDQP